MDILIEEMDGQIWTAALKDGRLEGLEIDPSNELVRWGSIYWAKVIRIDAALDAVFLQLDEGNTGILYNRDVRYMDGKTLKKGGDMAIGRILSPGQMIAVQAKVASIAHDEDSLWPENNKVAQVSMEIMVQGRYLIYSDVLDENRISQRIRGKKLRGQIEEMLDSLDGMNGFILRAAAANTQTEVLQREAKIMKEMWSQISEFLDGEEPALIALGLDSIQRILSDHAASPIDCIEIVTMDHFTQVEEWCSIFAPDLMTKIIPLEIDNAQEDLALFEHRDLLGQVEALFNDYVMLPHGANIIIQDTAALTAIDVNKSSDKRSHLAVNLDAVDEAARQMRLRNIGGIVMIDLLKCSKKDEQKLLEAFKEKTFDDPCTVQVHGFTKLGLLEVARKRRTPALHDRFDGITI